MVWDELPPSDHAAKAQVACGDGALTGLLDPTITVRVNGAAAWVVPTVNCNPAGLDANVRSTVRGCSSTLVVL